MQDTPPSTPPAARDEVNPEVAIPPPTIIHEIRTGRLKTYDDLSIPTGIYKDIRAGRLYIDKVGLPHDEHDLTFHGGPDKAIHQYSTNHYPKWRELYPDAANKFQPGGFGENIVAAGQWDERTICIGDRVRIGHATGTHEEVGGEHGAVLEVSIPRQPCFKLNQKFGIKNFAPKTHERAWTGWYYRVVIEGYVEQGMELRVIARPNPKWTIERIHHYVHRDRLNEESLDELVGVPELGNESKNVLKKALKSIREPVVQEREVWRTYRLADVKKETSTISTFAFELIENSEADKPKIVAGSHIRLRLPNKLERPYSVVCGSRSRFKLGIKREENSRGGSAYLHDAMQIGDQLEVGTPKESVDINSAASNHILIVGGVGITAYLDVMNDMDDFALNYELHYAIRSGADIPFREALRRTSRQARIRIYDKSKDERLNVRQIMENRKWNSHIYVCGPTRMMEEADVVAKELGIPDEEMHYEAFSAITEGDPFEAEVVLENGEEKMLHVGQQQTLLQVMRDAGLDMPSSCEVGNCGTCKVKVLAGEVEHRGSGTGDGKRGSRVDEGEMLSCLSRGKGRLRVECF